MVGVQDSYSSRLRYYAYIHIGICCNEQYFALTVKMRFRLNFADFTKFFQIYQIPWVSLPFSNTGKFSKGSDPLNCTELNWILHTGMFGSPLEINYRIPPISSLRNVCSLPFAHQNSLNAQKSPSSSCSSTCPRRHPTRDLAGRLHRCHGFLRAEEPRHRPLPLLLPPPPSRRLPPPRAAHRYFTASSSSLPGIDAAAEVLITDASFSSYVSCCRRRWLLRPPRSGCRPHHTWGRWPPPQLNRFLRSQTCSISWYACSGLNWYACSKLFLIEMPAPNFCFSFAPLTSLILLLKTCILLMCR
jgi:hypothetical protein